MKILKNKTFEHLIEENKLFYVQMRKAESLHETGKAITHFILDTILPKEIKKTRQEMIKNFEEQNEDWI